jgi:hypothetical protein
MIHSGGLQNERNDGQGRGLAMPADALVHAHAQQLPAIVARAGERASRRFLEFFTANIRNRNTRAAYGQAVGQFLRWCEHRQLELTDLSPIVVAAYSACDVCSRTSWSACVR